MVNQPTPPNRNRNRQSLSKAEASQIEQRTLYISLYGVVAVAFGSLAYGVYIQSDVVILNGIFSMLSLIGSGLNLAAAKLVVRPEDKRFQYGYWHVEPLVHCVNGLMMLIICIYAFLNGIEGIRGGGSTVDSSRVILFSIITGMFCGCIWFYESRTGARINSQLLKNDSKEWLMDFSFSMVTLVGFLALYVLEEPALGFWKRYADNAMVSIMSLLLLPLPLRVLYRNLPEVLLMTGADDVLGERVEAVMRKIKAEYRISGYSSHVVKVGRSHFIEVNILASPDFELQSIAQQDKLRERILAACEKPLDEVWLSVSITADQRWS